MFLFLWRFNAASFSATLSSRALFSRCKSATVTEFDDLKKNPSDAKHMKKLNLAERI